MAVRVLVVDDTDHVRSMLCDMLRLDGFDVVAAVGHGAEAAPAVAEHRPDVVIMDLRMPGVDGLEATRRVKAVRPEQVVILYTAYLDPVVEAQAKEAGVSVCLGKVEGIPELERELSRLAMELTPDS
jgi:CheY-like chemotaxis protein